MGVQGLWKLLESTGKPIPVEKLENKVLSIDASIWMYQIIKGVRESDHNPTTNKHLIVMFHRICKLLFFGIKPIFVFDGGVPELKKITIAQRQAQKSRAKKSSGKTKEKIIKNILEQAALKTVMDTGNTLTEDEVISKTVNSLNKETEIDLFELPKMPKSLELEKTKQSAKEKEQAYLTSCDKTTEHILLLAVENQDNDFLCTDNAKEKEKSSPAKLNAFSSLQIGELLNGFSDDQKRLAERKKQQQSKREMTLNELEMFLNNDNTNNTKIDEFGQKIDSDYDTLFYYESDINKASKSNTSKSDKISNTKITLDSENSVKPELKNTSKKLIVTDAIGSPTLTDDIDEDIFKALAGDESLEEDRLAWLIFNENKKASKRRSSEFESPNIKCFKSETSVGSSDYSEMVTSDMEEDFSIKNNEISPKKHSSKSILIAENNTSNETFNSFKNEDFQSWVSYSEDGPSQMKLDKKESSIDLLNVPSTSKSIPFIVDDKFSSKSDEKQHTISKSLYFVSKNDKSEECDVFSNSSPSIQSDISNGPLSENSLDFSSEESLSNDITEEDTIILDTQNKQKESSTVQNFKTNVCSPIVSQTESKFSSSDNKTLRSPIQFDTNSIESSKQLDNQTNPVDEQYLQSIQDSLISRQNDLTKMQRTSDRMASSITQKITSDIKSLLRLFGIPYMTAPMEAEAQCVFLEKIGFTEGTVTDDSDVWLFGANVVYKDFFDSHKYVKQFRSIDIKQKFALSRNSFIQLAFLVGSDYTSGIDGIGPVSAIEILSFFESKTKNMNIEEKLLKIKELVNSKSETFSDIPFMKKLKSTKLGSDFPNKAVINAYLNPIVNESNEKFKWDIPDEDLIIQFAQKNFDWCVSKTKSTLTPVLKKVSERTKQKSLDSYIKMLPKLSNTNTGMSKRVSLAVKRLRNDSSSVTTNNQKSGSPKKSTSTAPSNKRVVDKKSRKNL